MAKTEATVAADITTEMAKDATTDTKAATDAAATKEKNSTDKGLKSV